MKKLIILICICALMLCSCAIDENKYPQVQICPTTFRADTTYIALRDDHQFSRTNPYDEVETEQGYDIIIHVRRNKND